MDRGQAPGRARTHLTGTRILVDALSPVQPALEVVDRRGVGARIRALLLARSVERDGQGPELQPVDVDGSPWR